MVVQIFLPLRHLLSNFYVTDPNTGESIRIDLSDFLTTRQASNMAYFPDFPLQFAHYLATVMPRRGPKPLQVQARIFVSINGRKLVLYVNPIVDLAAEPRTLGRPYWLLRNDEPLPPREKRYQMDE